MAKTDHDILLALEADMRWLKKIMSNHLRHHWMITIVLLTGIIALIVRSLI